MNLNNYYVLVDTKTKVITGSIQLLPENWHNIHGLSGLTDDEIANLDWTGNEGLGWINLCSNDLKSYESSDDNLENNKLTLKRLISQERKDELLRPILFEDITVVPDKTTYTMLMFKKLLTLSNPELTVNFKFQDKYKTINASQINDICAIIDNQIQSSFDSEMKLFQEIESCNHICEFRNINYNVI